MSTLTFSEINDNSEVDIAIIGAGISGLYCAYRLLNSPEFKGKKIAIYERLNRTGGRLQSDLIPVVEDTQAPDNGESPDYFDNVKVDLIKEEQGGMRFNYDMTELMTLMGKLGLCHQVVPFPMSSTGNTNRYCIRGVSFSVAEANAGGNMIWSELYDLLPEEQGLSPVQIVTNAYNRILEENNVLAPDVQTPEYWQDFRLNYTWKNVPLNQWQLGGLLSDMGYSEECIEMLSDTIGFAGPFKYLPNAGDALQILADFPKDPTYYTFKYGFSTLPNKVVEEISGDVAIHLSTNIYSISGEEGNFEITMLEAPEGQNASNSWNNGTPKTIKAKQIISAIATKGFQSLFAKSPALNTAVDAQKLWETTNEVLGMNLMKINFYFKQAWWRNGSTGRPVIEFGPNFTDMPINSIYPFYAVDELDIEGSEVSFSSTDPAGTQPAALTLYCDFNNTNFWKGLQNVGEKFSSPLQEIYNNLKAQTIYPASKAVVAEARKQMGKLFGVTNVPEPIFTSYRLWNGEDDFEHAYHQWKLNADDATAMEYLSNPIPGVYMCNEAISDMQGWVNGSLRSSNRALDKISNGAIQPLEEDLACQSSCSTNDSATKEVSFNLRRGLWGA